MSEPLNTWDFERLAEAKVEAGPWGYFVGGAGDERTLAENLAAFRRWAPAAAHAHRRGIGHHDDDRPRR